MFKCKLEYIPSPHLSQIYVGFEQLRKNKLIEYLIVSSQPKKDKTKPILKVIINNRYTVIFDTLDGLNWIDGSINENLDYFRNNIKADFYFKRSFNKQVADNSPPNCKVYPLGLNYKVKVNTRIKGINETVKDFILNNEILRTIFRKSERIFNAKKFEFYPLPQKINKILFFTRLWNPDIAPTKLWKEQIEQLNRDRVNFIRACRMEFSNHFMGGIQKDDFSIRYSRDLISPFDLTKKGAFLNLIKEHNICIATTGLYNSIGWKFAEYIAASRAIVSEPLVYLLPGEFEKGKNYLVFSNENELINQIYFLMNNKVALFNMMKNNYDYYHNFLRPDKLIMNVFLTIYNDINGY